MPRQRIYVALLDEGVDSWRPVTAQALGQNHFPLIGPMPEEEVWEFQPGEVVLFRPHTFSGGEKGLVAFKRGDA